MKVFDSSDLPATVNFEEFAHFAHAAVPRAPGCRDRGEELAWTLIGGIAGSVCPRGMDLKGLKTARITQEWPQKALKPRFFPILLNIYGFSVIISSVIFDVFGPLGGV